jgi:hypothetical protein
VRYHHIGIPTETARKGEVYIEKFKMHVVGFDTNPYGVEWLRFDPDCTLPELVKTVPHVAFSVPDLAAAMKGKEVLIAPNRPSEGVTVAFIEHNGAPVEFLQFDAGDEQEVLAAFEKTRVAKFAGDREALEALYAEDYGSVSIHGTSEGTLVEDRPAADRL